MSIVYTNEEEAAWLANNRKERREMISIKINDLIEEHNKLIDRAADILGISIEKNELCRIQIHNNAYNSICYFYTQERYGDCDIDTHEIDMILLAMSDEAYAKYKESEEKARAEKAEAKKRDDLAAAEEIEYRTYKRLKARFEERLKREEAGEGA